MLQSADIPENLNKYVAINVCKLGVTHFGKSYQVCEMCSKIINVVLFYFSVNCTCISIAVMRTQHMQE